MQVNDLIFKELIKRGFSLNGSTRIWNIADSKLWYLKREQAQAYLDLDNDPVFRSIQGHQRWEDLIEKSLTELAQIIGKNPVNIIDLGCGDGKKTAFFIRKLRGMGEIQKMRYCPIDISGYMVSKAMETFSKLNFGDIIDFKWNISDFENLENATSLLKTEGYKKNVIFFLGNTLGNFEIHEMLYTIRKAMDKEDILIIDNGLENGKMDEVTKLCIENEKFNDWLIYIPLQLGLDKKDIKIDGAFRNSRIEIGYTLMVNKEIKFQDKKIQFMKGDQIIVLIAYKYADKLMKSYLNMHFGDVNAKISPDKSKILAICRI